MIEVKASARIPLVDDRLPLDSGYLTMTPDSILPTPDSFAYVSLGSNLGDRAGNLLLAVRELLDAIDLEQLASTDGGPDACGPAGDDSLRVRRDR